jgi:hypothetical protein
MGEKICDAAHTVLKVLGPGLLERVCGFVLVYIIFVS